MSDKTIFHQSKSWKLSIWAPDVADVADLEQDLTSESGVLRVGGPLVFILVGWKFLYAKFYICGVFRDKGGRIQGRALIGLWITGVVYQGHYPVNY